MSQPPPPSHDVPASPRPSATSSRRRFLVGAGAAIAAVSALGLGAKGSRSVGAVGGALDAPGEAFAPARRVTPPTTTAANTPPTTSVPGRAAPSPTVAPPQAGEILFPIVVGPGDTCVVSDNFGACRDSGCSRSHEGTDIMADHLLPVRAVVTGELTKQYVATPGTTSGAGNGWTLYDATTDITYKFFHMDHHTEGLVVGDTVEAGQIIGAVGNTGTSGANSDTNYHLHFEYRPGDVAQRSYDLLQRAPYVRFV